MHSERTDKVSLIKPPSFSGASLDRTIGAGARMRPSEEELEAESSLMEDKVFLFIMKKRKMEIIVRSTSS